MKKPLSCYYVDEPLNEDERQFAEECLLGDDADFATGATLLLEKRVPNILPVAGADGLHTVDPREHIEMVKRNLRKAGIHVDGGKQVVFVIPKDIRWGAIFQMAIHEETGFMPYALQRWYYDEDEPERRDPRIIDGHGMIGGKD